MVLARIRAPDLDERAADLAAEEEIRQDVRFAALAEPAQERPDDAARSRTEGRRAHEVRGHLRDVGRRADEDGADRPERAVGGAGPELAVDAVDEFGPVDLGPRVEHGADALEPVDVVLDPVEHERVQRLAEEEEWARELLLVLGLDVGRRWLGRLVLRADDDHRRSAELARRRKWDVLPEAAVAVVLAVEEDGRKEERDGGRSERVRGGQLGARAEDRRILAPVRQSGPR